jgi:hypothetical protein
MAKRRWDPLSQAPFQTSAEQRARELDRDADKLLKRMAVDDPRRKQRPKGERRPWKRPKKGERIFDWAEGRSKKQRRKIKGALEP